MLSASPIPSISITPAPPEKNCSEPFSPFPPLVQDGYRTSRLSSSPAVPPTPLHRLSCKALGLDQLNQVSQVQSDLREELALKGHYLKQFERRAHFPSKINALSTGAFPFEFLENSEGLVAVDSPVDPGCDGQMQRDLAELPLEHSLAMPKKSRRIPPSLDEITARLRPVHTPFKRDRSRSRLPDFLKTFSLSPDSTGAKPVLVRSLALNDEGFDTTFTQRAICPSHTGSWTLTAVFPHTVDLAERPTLHPNRVTLRAAIKHRTLSPSDLSRHESTRTSSQTKRRSAPVEVAWTGTSQSGF